MKKARWLLGLVWLAVAAWAGVGVAERFIFGHRLAGYTSYVPWGMWVAAYIYFIGLSAGAFLMSSLVYVFRVRTLEPVAPLALVTALVTLLMALLSIWFDLGHLERFYEVFTRPNFHSMMAWMVWLYTAYFLLLLAETYLALRARLAPGGDQPLLRRLGLVGVPLAIAFHGGVGALFATVIARDYWHNPLYPILFLTGALTSGGGLLTALVSFTWSRRDAPWQAMVRLLGRITLGLVLLDVLLEWAEYSVPMWYGVGPEFELLRYVLFGPRWYVYWVVHIALGVAVPVVLLTLRGDRPETVGLAGALVALTFFAVRLHLVIPGLITPQLRGLESAYRSPRLSYQYVPTLFEWQVTLFVAALGAGMLYLAYRYLPIRETAAQVTAAQARPTQSAGGK